MPQSSFDLIVIGGGPAGYAGAIAAGHLGRNVLLVEADQIGGTCLNVGCIPTKYLLDKAHQLDRIRHMTRKGIFREAGQFSFAQIQKGKDTVVKKLTDGVQSLLKNSQVTVMKGKAKLLAPGKVLLDGRIFESEYILLATGSKVFSPPIPGAEQHTIDSTKALSLSSVPKRLAVIGGGVIGLELASAYQSFGSQVVVFEILPELLPGEDVRMIRALKKMLHDRGIEIRTDTMVTNIGQNGQEKIVSFKDKNGTGQFIADVVLMAAGRKANQNGIDDPSLNLEFDRQGFVKVDAAMQTNLLKVYAAGDIAGGWQLAHSAYIEAETAVYNMFEGHRSIDQAIMPRCIYTHPPYAAVGLNQLEAEKQGHTVSIGKFAFGSNGMALAEDVEEGMAQVIVDRETNKLLGFQILGQGAPELIATATVAITADMTAQQWERVIIAHPSLSEILREAILDSIDKSIHSIHKKKAR